MSGNEQRPGGWVDGIGWVAKLCDLDREDVVQVDGGESADEPVGKVRLGDWYEPGEPFIVVRWADGTSPVPSVDDEQPDTDGPEWSNTAVNGVRQTWQQLYEAERDRRQASDEWRTLVSDLDRCGHGRHEADACSSCGGPSAGNPFLPTGTVIGTTLHAGQRIVIPERTDRNRIEAWYVAADAHRVQPQPEPPIVPDDDSDDVWVGTDVSWSRAVGDGSIDIELFHDEMGTYPPLAGARARIAELEAALAVERGCCWSCEPGDHDGPLGYSASTVSPDGLWSFYVRGYGEHPDGWDVVAERADSAIFPRVQPQPDELRAALEAIVAHTERPAAWTWDDRMEVRRVAMAALAASPAVPGSGLNPGEVVAFPNEVHDLHGGSWEAEVGLNYWVPTTDFIHPCATRFVCRPRLAASPATEAPPAAPDTGQDERRCNCGAPPHYTHKGWCDLGRPARPSGGTA